MGVVGDLRELAGMFTESVEAYRRAARLRRDDPARRGGGLHRQAAAHLRTGAFQHDPAGRRPGAGADRRLGRAEARRTRCVWTSSPHVVRVEQQRPREAREWALRAIAEAGAVGEHETQVAR